jgi:hypothetical protein
MRGKESPDRHHLAMRRGVLFLNAEIAAARQHPAVAHDHGAEREVAERRLFQRDPHEGHVLLGCRPVYASGEGGDGCRQGDGAKRAGNQVAAAHAEGLVSGGCLHVLIS